jgi:uncharacterized membrane protein
MNAWLPWLRGWPGVIGASAIAAAVLLHGLPALPLRGPILLWFLVVCPGMAFVQLLRLDNPVLAWVLAVALSFALTSLVAMAMVYTAWSPERGFNVLLLITAAGLALSLRRHLQAYEQPDSGGRGGRDEASELERAA